MLSGKQEAEILSVKCSVVHEDDEQGEGEDFVPMKITYYAFAALPRIGDTLDVPSGDGLSFSRHRVNAVHHVPTDRYTREPYAVLYVSTNA
jgi:hypothetical protein